MKNNIVLGLGVAVAATVLAPVLLPALGGVGRPLAKSLVKGGMSLYEKGRESLALAGESLEDMMAEIRAEETARSTAKHPPPANDEPSYRGNGANADATAQSAGTVGL